MLKAGAGLIAGVVAGGLGYCFWPRLEPSVLASRPAVEKPIFVVASASAAPAAPGALVGATPAPAQPSVPDNKGELDKLAAALKAHPQATRGITLASVESASPALPAPSEEAAKFCAEGLVALAAGDIASARLFLTRAAEAGDPRALMALGDTYDAPTLARLGVVGMHGDSDRAHEFYARALAAGVDAAKQRIAALEARGN